MPEPKAAAESIPLHHVGKLKQMLNDVATHARSDSEKVPEPRAQALLETTAEVLFALRKACDDYEKKNEAAWK